MKTPLKVRCEACSHEWIAAYLPMEMGAAAKLLFCLCCPMCAQDSKRIFAMAEESSTDNGQK